MELIDLPNEMIEEIFKHFSIDFLSLTAMSSLPHIKNIAGRLISRKIQQKEVEQCHELAIEVIKLIGSPMSLNPDKFHDIILSEQAILFSELNDKYLLYKNLFNYINFVNKIYEEAGQLLFADWRHTVMKAVIELLNEYGDEYYSLACALRDNPFG
jgi:hypothetical protein